MAFWHRWRVNTNGNLEHHAGESAGDDPRESPIATATLPPPQSPPPPSAAPSEPPASELRSKLIGKFEQWLDQMLADDAPPRGIPDDLLNEATTATNGDENASPNDTDLYTLFSALTGLTGEIRLQGRAFKQLTDLLSPLSEMPAALAQLREAQIESAASIQEAVAERADEPDALPIEFERVCEVMIDLYDRLKRGLQTCDEGIRSLQPRPRSRWARLLGDSNDPERAIRSVRGIRDASALTLARLQAALQEWGIQRIGEIGEPFDAERMTAVEVRPADDAEPGSVLEVNRSGYAINGTPKATAQVTVAKAAARAAVAKATDANAIGLEAVSEP